VKEDEMLGWTLLSLHNIVYLHNMVNTIQQRILNS
jgi:queuine/archaeosine tRNA-ribosyltransferase